MAIMLCLAPLGTNRPGYCSGRLTNFVFIDVNFVEVAESVLYSSSLLRQMGWQGNAYNIECKSARVAFQIM